MESQSRSATVTLHRHQGAVKELHKLDRIRPTLSTKNEGSHLNPKENSLKGALGEQGVHVWLDLPIEKFRPRIYGKIDVWKFEVRTCWMEGTNLITRPWDLRWKWDKVFILARVERVSSLEAIPEEGITCILEGWINLIEAVRHPETTWQNNHGSGSYAYWTPRKVLYPMSTAMQGALAYEKLTSGIGNLGECLPRKVWVGPFGESAHILPPEYMLPPGTQIFHETSENQSPESLDPTCDAAKPSQPRP